MLLIAGAIAIFILRPWESQVERHKRALLAASDPRWLDRFRDTWNSSRGRPPAWVQRMERHETALIQLGHFERREFFITNIAPADAVQVVGRTASKVLGGGPWRIQAGASNLVVTAARADMPLWEELIRKAQQP